MKSATFICETCGEEYAKSSLGAIFRDHQAVMHYFCNVCQPMANDLNEALARAQLMFHPIKEMPE